MEFSVVIPLYNKEHYIVQALESVLVQTYRDFEVIVVDDGSKDRSLELARSVASEKLRLLSQPNQGVSVARNTGIANARGEYIAFLDADDEWEPEYLQTISGLIRKYPQSDIFVTAYRVDLGGGKIRQSRRLSAGDGCLDSYWMTLGGGYEFVWTSATVVRRQALLDAGCFRPGELIGQDLDMWARVARNNPRVAYSPESRAVYHRQAEENARTRVKVAYPKAFLALLEEEMDAPHSRQERQCIRHKYESKMTAYIFTCILDGQRKRALEALKGWRGGSGLRGWILRAGLLCACAVPGAVCRRVYQFRLRVF